MNQQVKIIPIEVTDEGVNKFLENEDIKEKIRQIKETEEYKNMNKFYEHPVIKDAAEESSDQVKNCLKEFDESFEQTLFFNVCINAIKVAFDKFVAESGKSDIIQEIVEYISFERVDRINNLLIDDVAKNIISVSIIDSIVCDLFGDPKSEEES